MVFLSILSQLIFSALLITAVFIFMKRVKQIRKNVLLGKDEVDTTNPKARRKNMFLIAFGQKKMFQRPVPAFLHLLVYVGFLIVNIELLEIIADGLTGGHRVFAPLLGSFYPILINFFEFLAVLVLLSCVVFLIRRNIIRIPRFRKPEMKDWPTLDANLILIFEVVLMFFLLNMNATDTVLQNRAGHDQSFFFSNLFTGLYSNAETSSVYLAERTYWWLHICGIFFFANYVLLSKHLHIFLAFPATYFASLKEKGEIPNMEAVTTEVKIMLGMEQPSPDAPTEIARFGVKDVEDLSWKHILNAYTCTECGRCTDNCPANLTGKKLSPRKIMMDVRDRAEELGLHKAKNGDDSHDGKSLADEYITEEELFACTTCNACTEACPINLNPLEIIMDLRRFKAMEESKGPSEWMLMYQNMETSFAPWKMPAQDRFKWAEELKNNK